MNSPVQLTRSTQCFNSENQLKDQPTGSTHKSTHRKYSHDAVVGLEMGYLVIFEILPLISGIT